MIKLLIYEVYHLEYMIENAICHLELGHVRTSAN